MTFYHRTVYPPCSITHSVIGNFLDKEKEDIIVSTGRILKLLRFELGNTSPELGHSSPSIQTLISVDTYDIITSLTKFRRQDETKDWVVIAADSGCTTILFVNDEEMEFQVVVECKFEVQTLKRTFPVEHLAVDSQGCAFSIAAMEEAKQFWFFQGAGNREFKILNDHEKKTLIYDIAFVDISEKIVVAYLATAYEEPDIGLKYENRKRHKPTLVFEEVNADEKTEIRRIKCLDYANSLISVPGKRGVLVCAEDFIAFYSLDSSTIIRCSIPQRMMDPKPGVIFGCYTKCNKKMFQNPNPDNASSFLPSTQDSIYYLAQTEQGDIFRIQLVVDESGVNEIVLKYFVTLPVASALCTFESGLLFVASEFGNHYVYKITDIENCARVHPSFSSALALPKGKPFLFMHRILNIESVYELKSMSPMMQIKFKPLSSKTPRMCLAMGRASLSALKVSVEEDVSNLICYKIEKEEEEIPLHMWAIESTVSISKESKTLIVVSFEYETAVYSLDRTPEYLIQKMKDTPFAVDTNTLGCAKTGKDAIVQVCPEGVCLITDKQNKLIYKYIEGKKNSIEECAMNKKSLVIAIENRELMHYKIDENGLVMKSEIPRRLLSGPVTCMLLSDKNESDQLLAVGILIPPPKRSSSSKVFAIVNEVHLFNIGLSDIKCLYMLKVESSPYSFLFVNEESDQQSLLVGCEDGTLLTLAIEETAETEGTTKHKLKVKDKKICSAVVQLHQAPFVGKENPVYGILAVSTKEIWFKETVDGEFFQLQSDISPCMCMMPNSESIATIEEDQLRVFILKVEGPVTFPLEYTPKKFDVDSDTGNIYIIETDNNSYTEETKKKEIEFKMHVKHAQSQQDASNLPAIEKIPKSWASILRVVNISGVYSKEIAKIPFQQNEAALSLCSFKDILLVGTATNFNLSSGCCTEASIYTYRILEQGKTIKRLRKTDVKSAPFAMCKHEENVLIGIGRKLAFYYVVPESFELELICEKKDCVSNSITAIYSFDKRIVVCDSSYGVSYLRYVSTEKDDSLYLLKEDVFPSEVTAACFLSGNRMARATKSRDIFIMELGTLQERDMSEVYNEDEPPFTLSEEKILCCFHVGEVVTSMLDFPNKPDTVVYATLSGSVGILSHLPEAKDAEFFNLLYEALLEKAPEIDKKRTTLPIAQNSRFRALHFKRENVIDGDFLDEFLKLKVGLQKIIYTGMDEEELAEISTKLENLGSDNMLYFQF